MFGKPAHFEDALGCSSELRLAAPHADQPSDATSDLFLPAPARTARQARFPELAPAVAAA